MLSTSAISGASQQQQQLVQAIPAPAAAPPPTSGRLSLEDISKYFNLPIADAATILGVCTSVLKRICRENGIIRWPYRKFLAGKTFDDIKKEAAREKSKELAGLSNTAKQNLDAPKMMHSMSAGLSTFGNQVQNRAPGHQGISMSGNALQPQGNKSFQHGWSSTVQTQTKHVPTYLDDFKHGFPSNGLASASTKWWGTSCVESDEKFDSAKSATNEEEKQDSCKLTNEPSRRMMVDEQPDSNIKDSAITADSSASLVSLRKKVVECGRESIQVGLSNCGSYKLGPHGMLSAYQFKTSLDFSKEADVSSKEGI